MRRAIFITALLAILALGQVGPAAAGPFAYITNVGDGTLSVLDTATNLVTATVGVSNGGGGVAVSPDGTRVYVGDYYRNSVRVVSTATNTVIDTVPVPYPNGLAVTPDGAAVYVASGMHNLGTAGTVAVIATATNTVTATVPLGTYSMLCLEAVVVSPDGGRVYVTGWPSDSEGYLFILDTATNTLVTTVPVGAHAVGAAITPDGGRVYVANFFSFTVSVLSTATNTVTATVPLPTNRPFGAAITPDGGRVYITHPQGGLDSIVSVIDTATNTVTATIPVGASPQGIAVTPDGTRVYVLNAGSGTVSVIATATNTVVATVPVGESPMAFGQFIGPDTVGTGFTQADLTGTWHQQIFQDVTATNAPQWGACTLTVGPTGTVTDGTCVNSLGGTATVTAGVLTIDGTGQVTGGLSLSNGFNPTFPDGKLDPSKTILALVADPADAPSLVVAIKGGGTFTQADLTGTWHQQIFQDSTVANGPLWVNCDLTVGPTGAFTGGTCATSSGTTLTVIAGVLTIDGTGQVTGGLSLSNGFNPTFPDGKLDPSKTILALVADPADAPSLVVAIKGGGTFTQADLTGTWHQQIFQDSTVANGPLWVNCDLTVGPTGAFTGGTCATSSGTTLTVIAGVLTIDGTGQVTGGLSLSNGFNPTFHGKLDPSKTILALVANPADAPSLAIAIKGSGSVTTYALTVVKAGTGEGTVTSSPAGIDCGTTCSASFDEIGFVTLTATPEIGSTFTGWSGDPDCSDGAVTTLEARSCTATFTLNSYALTVARVGTGSGTVTSNPAGIDCGTDCTETYSYGTGVTLTATSAIGSTFTGWSGDADCSDGAVTMNAALSCTATFTLAPPPQYVLTVTKTGTGTGTVTSAPTGIDCGSSCSAGFTSGTVVTLTATPTVDSLFTGWSGDADCSDGAVTMSGAWACTANFMQRTTHGRGRIVVVNDDWVLSNTGFAAPNDPGTFATNVAAWFTGGRTGKFHAFSDHFGLTGSSLAAAMATADHTWTTGTADSVTLPTLQQYDGIFLLPAPREAPVDTTVLIAYVEAGGNVYLAYSGDPSHSDEQYNAFVTHFGLGLGGFNELVGNVAISSPHPIFAGVDHLYNVNGSDIVDLAPADPRQRVLVSQNGHGLYAVYEGNVPHTVGLFRPSDGTFYLDYKGNGVWDGCGIDRCLSIGMNGDIPLVGDWNGSGTSKVGAFRPSDGTFYLDYNGSGTWEGCGVDRCLQIGMLGDIPLVGDWDGTGSSKVGAFRPSDGTFYLDYNGNGVWDGCGTDRCLQIGMNGDIPLVGDWNASGTSKVGAFRPSNGTFYLDYNGSGTWEGCATDRCLSIGMNGDIPLVGDWNGIGTAKVGVFRPSDGIFYLDYNGSGTWDGCGTDRCLQIGMVGDIPLVGDWNGSGTSKVGAFRPSDGTFYLDYNGSGTWEGCGTDRCLSIGMNGDKPLVGKW